MRNFWQDIRYGVRMLGKEPGFTFIAVLTLALGIGANTAIFSVLDSVLLRTLPVSNPWQLVLLTDPDSHGSSYGSESGDRSLLAYSEFEYFRDHNEVFSNLFAADSSLAQVPVVFGNSGTGAAGDGTQTAHVRLVSGDYFSTLQVWPVAGRVFTSEVDRARGGAPVAVISYPYWKQHFHLSPSALGETIQIHGTAFEIIGVTPPWFYGETVGKAPDIWVPMTMQDAIYPGRDLLSPAQGIVNQYMWLQVMARLKPGISLEQAKASINVLFKREIETAAGTTLSPEQFKQYSDQRIDLKPGARGSSTLSEPFGKPLKVLMALVGLVLLIACANVANLLLARGAARQREFAVRLAMGAGRSRLIRQLLTESVLLALVGAAAGLLLGQWVDALLLRMVSEGDRGIELGLRLDGRTLGFALVVAILAVVLFGLLPALRATRLDLTPGLKSTPLGAAGGTAERRFSAVKLLVVAQVTVSLILLVAAGLFVHSLTKLSEVKLGYNRENLLLFRVKTDPAGYKGAAIIRFHQDLLAKFEAIPGVSKVTLSQDGLFSHSESGDPVEIEGYTPKPSEEMSSRFDHVGPGYFSTVGIPVLIGREIEARDSHGPHAGVINQTFAKRYFPGVNPIGKHVRDPYPGNPGEAEIVGVVADAKYNELREKTPPRIYAPYFNPLWDQRQAVYEVRVFADPAGVAQALRKTVHDANPAIPEVEINTMSSLVDDSLHTDRFVARLSSAFGALAMLLASIGLYGVMAYTVARRTREIGIRMALGAQPGRVLWNTLRETLLLMLVGTVLGVPIALAGARLIQSMLFGLGAADPVAIGIAVMTLAGVAVVAGLVPARRASRVDPMVALRYD